MLELSSESLYKDNESNKPPSRKYRDRLDILADMVKKAKQCVEEGHQGVGKTEMMYKANLSYKLLVKYSKMAIGFNLLFFDEKKEIYKPTDKGEKFLGEYKSYSKKVKEYKKLQKEVQAMKAKLEKMLGINKLKS